MLHAAAEAGVEAHVVADVERRRSLLERLLEGLGPNAEAAAYAIGGVPPIAPGDAAERPPAGDELRDLIRTAIEEMADAGDAVIVAHAASVALAGRDDVLRVLVTASPETRRRRLAEARGLDEKESAKALGQADAARADYLKRFYGIGAELPTHYDLVLNTDRIAPTRAAELIEAATR